MKSKEYIKGTLRTIILKLLSENHRMYGYEITQRVAQLSSNEIQLTYGALYPILYKLQSEGLLETSNEIVDGRARKYYALTQDGKKVAVEKVADLQRFAITLMTLLSPQPKLESACL